MKRPLILDFCENSIQEEKPPFFYDEDQDINLIKHGNSIVPFIDLDRTYLELMTKTKVKREQDDCPPFPFLELLTKTFVDRKQDDEHPWQE